MVKKFYWLACVFFLFVSGWSIVINKIKITGNVFTSSSLILAMASELKEGKEISERELEKLAMRIEERLRNTTWFYLVRVYLVPSSHGDNYRNVVIEVREGFLWRFGGGNAYGMVGKENIDGKGKQLFLYLGYNRQGITWEWEDIFPHISAKGRLGNFEESYYHENGEQYFIQRVGGRMETTYRLSWDSRLGLEGGYEVIFDDAYRFLFSAPTIGGFYLFDCRDDIFSARKGFYGKIGFQYIIDTTSIVWRGDIRYFFPLFRKTRVAFRGIVEKGDETMILFCSHLFGINGVRSFGLENRIGETKVMGSIEGRHTILQSVVFGFMNIVLEGMIFFDVGYCNTRENGFSFLGIKNIPYGWGGGLRLYFMEPIYVPLRCEVGFTEWNKPVFFFAVEEPF